MNIAGAVPMRSRNKYTWCETRAIINDDNDNEKEYWFGRLGDETVHIDFEERFWYKVFGLIKE